MKKIFLFLVMALCALGINAQQGHLILSTPEVQVEYQVTAMSPNGRWACGNINDGNYRGFIWDLVSGEVTELSATGDISIAFDVSDDGVVVGSFTTTEGTPNNAPVETYGKWEKGKWSELPLTTAEGVTLDRDGYAQAISADGKTIAGIGAVAGKYYPLVWKDGEVQIVDEITGAVYDVSADGEVLCGWTTHPTKNNRTCAIWVKDAEGKYSDKIQPDIKSLYSAGPFVVARGVSPNAKYVSAFRRLYEMDDRKSTILKIDDEMEFEAYGATNDASVFGYIGDGYGSREAVLLAKDGTITKLREYFISQGVNMDKYPNLFVTIAVSEDQKTFAVIAYDTEMIPRSLVIKLGVETENASPVALKAQVLEGVSAVKLYWNAPLSNSKNVKGYNLYRDGVKVNEKLLTTTSYIEENVNVASAVYTVTAVYAEAESGPSEPVEVTIVSQSKNAPRNFFGTQFGLNNARFSWEAPFTNLPIYKYYDKFNQGVGLGGGTFGLEGAIRIRTSELEIYRKQGYKVSEVSFIPMSKQAGWTISLYYEDDTEPFYEQQVEPNSLTYGVENRVKLIEPQEIPEDVDIMIGVKVDTEGFGGYSVLGVVPKRADAGYSDLIRQEGKGEFMSMYKSGLSSQSGSYEFNISWAIGAVFSKENNNTAEVKEYVIYKNGEEISRLNETSYLANELSDGKYEYQLEAVYADGSLSERVKTNFNVSRNEAAFKTIVPEIKTKGAKMTATWDEPKDNDEQVVTYASNVCTGGMIGAEADQYSYMAAVKYDKNKLSTLGGYVVKAFRFYPLSDADFTFILNKDNEEIVYLPLEREVDYKIGQWNTIYLEKPIELDVNSNYVLVLDCYDVTPETAPLGMDDQIPYPEKSDLYSTDDGETFLSLSAQGGKEANWMLGMVVESQMTCALPLNGYNIYLNGKLHNADLWNATNYEINDLTDGNYTLRVNPVYEGTVGEKSSAAQTFVIDIASAIDNVNSSAIQVVKGAEYIQVKGQSVKSLTLYDLRGAVVAKSNTNSVRVATLNASVYVLKVKVGDKEVSVKVQL